MTKDLTEDRPHSNSGNSSLEVARIQPAYRQVTNQLRDRIISGSLAPGDRLPSEAELSTLFGVSRSTIREALRLLSSQSLIRTTRGVKGGTFVTEIDPAEVTDQFETSLGLLRGNERISVTELLEARQLLEVPAARLAAERRTEAHIEAMKIAIDLEKPETERGRRFEHHQEFHSLILDAAGNRLLRVMTVPIFRVIRSYFINDEHGAPDWHRVDDHHTRILEQIVAKDAGGAAQAMNDHLNTLRDDYEAAERAGASGS